MRDRFWLDWVPYFARSWPWIRRYYWQQEEIDAAKAQAKEWIALFGEHQERNDKCSEQPKDN